MNPQIRYLVAGNCLLLALVAGCATVTDGFSPLYEEGLRAMAAGDYATAMDKLEAATAAEPDNLRYGTDYRQAVIAAGEYDRCLKFFEQLVAENPQSPNAILNLGYAYVDKIPGMGSVTQVQLANSALTHFTTSLELRDTWLVRYTRGNSYVFWPAIFNRAPMGIEDLERALEIAKDEPKGAHHVRAWVALGDGYWRIKDLDRAREIWQEGLAMFPDNADLETRLAKEGEALDTYLIDFYDPNRRVVTDLKEIWEAEAASGKQRGRKRR